MSNSIIKKCPACSSDLIISRLSCIKCKIEITGDFTNNDFSGLTEIEKDFIKYFLLCEGNFSKLQLLGNESYLSVKEKLNNILIKLGLKINKNEITEETMRMIQPTNNDSEVVKTLKEKFASCAGKSYMSMLKGDDLAIWLADDGCGIITAGLKNVVLKWNHFTAIVEKANAIGGKMYRGDSAAQRGEKIGSDSFPLDTIDAFISTQFFGANVGDTTLRRSTYYSGILAWAGIADNYRSDGNGGYIIIRSKFTK